MQPLVGSPSTDAERRFVRCRHSKAYDNKRRLLRTTASSLDLRPSLSTSILVLLEDTLRVRSLTRLITVSPVCLNPCSSGRYSASLRGVFYSLLQDMVLILVLVEDTLRAYSIQDFKSYNNNSLNPCSSGRYSARSAQNLIGKIFDRLNPCSSGRYSARTSRKLETNGRGCLNPCSSGRYSASIQSMI